MTCPPGCSGKVKFTYSMLPEAMQYYYKIHGCTVNRLKDRGYEIIVTVPCQKEENKNGTIISAG